MVALWIGTSGAQAATSFASDAFRQQWQAGEAAQPNFWGPLATAHDGQNEPYIEGSLDFSESGPANPGQGMRRVQYFDKARMELTHPAQGLVTTGLLTVELKSGKVQLGDNTFEQRSPARINIAGDPGTDGLTYADLNNLPEHRDINAQTRALYRFNADHTFSLLSIADEKQYIPLFGGDLLELADPAGRYAQLEYGPFADFIARLTAAGIPIDQTPGYAISPIIVATVPIGGKATTVFVQAFERRVLTYNPNNAPAFRVEFGNIGQHYYRWRYGG